MKKLTKENILEKKQHMHILYTLYKHYDLTLHELTYLLTTVKNMYQLSELLQRFGSTRKNIFTSRQRINDCLTDLKHLKLVEKIGRKYRPNIFELGLCLLREETKRGMDRQMEELRKEGEKLAEEYEHISDEEKKIIVKMYWEEFEKEFPQWHFDENNSSTS